LQAKQSSSKSTSPAADGATPDAPSSTADTEATTALVETNGVDDFPDSPV